MDSILVARIIALAGFVFGLLGILARLRDIMNRPFKNDLARRGFPVGVLSFTGMAPGKRIHPSLDRHLRHLLSRGIFMAFGATVCRRG
jgi:hypothetical protein